MAGTILRKGGATAAGKARRTGDSVGAEAPVVRWQMKAIGEVSAAQASESRNGPRGQESPAPPTRPPEEELAAIRAAAHAQGRAEGLTEGRAAGAREIAELGALVGRLREVMDGFEQSLADDMVGLALEVSRQVLRHTIQVHPEVVLPVIREAIASLPQGSVHPRLLLHPEDAALVRSVLDANQITPAPWRIVEDSKLERGGCRVETAASELDASVASRWKTVIGALGREEGWVELDAAAGPGSTTAGRQPR